MNQRDIVVRIIQPADKAQPQKRESVPFLPPADTNKDLFHHILNSVGLAAIAALGIYLAFSFFGLGIAWKEVCIIVGIPLTLGLITGYVLNP
jgi:hypothetical protein